MEKKNPGPSLGSGPLRSGARVSTSADPSLQGAVEVCKKRPGPDFGQSSRVFAAALSWEPNPDIRNA